MAREEERERKTTMSSNWIKISSTKGGRHSMHSFLTTFRFGLEADFHVGLRNNRRWGGAGASVSPSHRIRGYEEKVNGFETGATLPDATTWPASNFSLNWTICLGLLFPKARSTKQLNEVVPPSIRENTESRESERANGGWKLLGARKVVWKWSKNCVKRWFVAKLLRNV